MKRMVAGRRLLLCGLGLVLLLAGIGSVSAQIPDEFENLKVLPKDISKRDLVAAMRSFAGALGVRCTYCHVGETPGSLEGVDFATDKLEEKKTARVMMKMVTQINEELLPKTGRESLVQVRCVTCHRGIEEPESLDHLLLEVIEEDGVDAAAAKYGELREKYYGKGSYAFGPGTLNSVAETLARERSDPDGAITLMKLNVEANPDAVFSHMMLGQLHFMKGDQEAAVTSIERALELEPDNQRAKQMLERMRSSE